MIPFKLYKGFENGNVVPSLSPNKIVILGGKLNYGHSKNVWEYDLEEGTVINRKPLQESGILTKYFQISDEKVLIFGEETKNKNNFKIYQETYDLKKWDSWVAKNVTINTSVIDKFKQYNFNQLSININYSSSSADKTTWESLDFS